MSWKVKRAVFRDWISVIQPEEDWSLFNLVQAVKIKVFNLPRKVIEIPKEVKPAPVVVAPVVVPEKIQETPPKIEKQQPVVEPVVAAPAKMAEESIAVPEEKVAKSPEKLPAKLENELEQPVAIDAGHLLPQVTMVPSSETMGESNLAKRKPEIASDRE